MFKERERERLNVVNATARRMTKQSNKMEQQCKLTDDKFYNDSIISYKSKWKHSAICQRNKTDKVKLPQHIVNLF